MALLRHSRLLAVPLSGLLVRAACGASHPAEQTPTTVPAAAAKEDDN